MIYELDSDNNGFPHPWKAEPNGLLAVGGDLKRERLISAYMSGIFPWYSEGEPILWWSPDPRMVLTVKDFKYSKSLRRVVKSGRFEVRIDTCFEKVMRMCGSVNREGQDGTWITEDMVKAYVELHESGYAHSFETFLDGQLVGGLYGVSIGMVFMGESMFHTVTDASKVAFVKLVEFCKMHNIFWIDAQQETEHLASLGACPIPRNDYLDIVEYTGARSHINMDQKWASHTAILLLGSNEGERQQLLKDAIMMIIQEVGNVSLTSQVYESAPWGFHANQWFLNQAVAVETELSAEVVLQRVLSIEERLGRRRKPETGADAKRFYTSRPIDIDVIFYDSCVIDTPKLKVPHPLLQMRRFVLVPLCNVCRQLEHPVLHKTVEQLLKECTDTGDVRLWFDESDDRQLELKELYEQMMEEEPNENYKDWISRNPDEFDD